LCRCGRQGSRSGRLRLEDSLCAGWGYSWIGYHHRSCYEVASAPSYLQVPDLLVDYVIQSDIRAKVGVLYKKKTYGGNSLLYDLGVPFLVFLVLRGRVRESQIFCYKDGFRH